MPAPRSGPSSGAGRTLRILHCLRTPIGGSFRHVCDLMRGQAGCGHETGLICASGMGGEMTAAALEKLEPVASLGVHRIDMSRQLAIGDLRAIAAIRRLVNIHNPDILHGHGAKGGAYARLVAPGAGAKAFYTPHGGSLHYSPSSPQGFVYLNLERFLARRTSGLLFESDHARRAFEDKVGPPPCPVGVIHNGVGPDDFAPVNRRTDAAEFLFIGELRMLKGVDVLLHALARVQARASARLVIVGDGPDAARLRALCATLRLDPQVTFAGPLPARAAFAMGQTLVIPSRAESLPYIVLEAAAAGIPQIATHVGGIPEIFGPLSGPLLPPGDADLLAHAMIESMNHPDIAEAQAAALQSRVRKNFSISAMVANINDFYGTRSLAGRHPGHVARGPWRAGGVTKI